MKTRYTIETEGEFQAWACVSVLSRYQCSLRRIGIEEPHRGKGLGSRLLRDICRDADRERITLWLIAHTSGPLSNAELAAWYRRYGFRGRPRAGMTRKPGPGPEEAEREARCHQGGSAQARPKICRSLCQEFRGEDIV